MNKTTWRQKDTCGNAYGPKFRRAKDGFWEATEDGVKVVLVDRGALCGCEIIPRVKAVGHTPGEPAPELIRDVLELNEWRRERSITGTRYESGVHEMNEKLHGGARDGICEELHENGPKGEELARAWQKSGGKYARERHRDPRVDRIRQGPVIRSNREALAYCKLSREILGTKKAFATYAD